MGDTEFDPWDLQPTNVATGEVVLPYEGPQTTFTVSPDASGDSFQTSAVPAPTPAANFGVGTVTQFGDSLKATAGSLFDVYKGWTALQIQKDQLDLQRQLTATSAARDESVAKAQAQAAIDKAQIQAANAKGSSIYGVPSQKVMFYATLVGLGVSIYVAFRASK